MSRGPPLTFAAQAPSDVSKRQSLSASGCDVPLGQPDADLFKPSGARAAHSHKKADGCQVPFGHPDADLVKPSGTIASHSRKEASVVSNSANGPSHMAYARWARHCRHQRVGHKSLGNLATMVQNKSNANLSQMQRFYNKTKTEALSSDFMRSVETLRLQLNIPAKQKGKVVVDPRTSGCIASWDLVAFPRVARSQNILLFAGDVRAALWTASSRGPLRSGCI